MKKFIVFLAAAAAVVCSCERGIEKSFTASGGDELVFGTYLSRATKAANATETAALNSVGHSMGMFAYYTDGATFDEANPGKPNFMYNEEVSYQAADYWSPAIPKYWPNESADRLSFYAYYPYMADPYITPAASAAGTPVVTVTDSDNELGVLWGKALNEQKKTVTFTDAAGRVNLTLYHASSRLEIGNVRAVIDGVAYNESTPTSVAAGTKIVVKNITVTVADVKPTGDLDLTDGSVTDLGGTPANKTFTIGEGTSYPINTALAWNAGLTATGLNSTTTSLAAETGAKTNLKYLPQTCNVTVTADYFVVTTDAKVDGGQTVVENNITSSAKSITTVSNRITKLNIDLGLTSVHFSASVEDWTDGETSQIDVPANTAS